MRSSFSPLVFLMLIAGGLSLSFPLGAQQETGIPAPAPQKWSFKGPFQTFDRAALQRGLQVYQEVCSTCHSLKHLSYRNLSALGYTEKEIKAIAAEHKVNDTNDQGEPVERPAVPADRFVSPYPNDKAARAANNGALPPDLSLMTKARKYGPDYLYALLTGFQQAPKDLKLSPGMHYNLAFPGHQIAMAPPLSDGQVTFADGTPATVQQMAHDVVTFLAWAAEPEMEARKQTGVMVIAFLLVFTAFLYASMKRIWGRVKH